MKKRLCLVTAMFFVLSCFAGCGGSPGEAGGQKLKIISTIFPSYDFAKQICGDKGEVRLLLPPGSESHSYEPTAKDIIAIQNCDLFIYAGGESDTWVQTILDSLEYPVRTVKMMDCVSAIEEETVEGMQTDKTGGHDHDGETEYDEHVWTSPKNAIKIVNKTAAAIAEADMENIDYYSDNASRYVEAIQQLDDAFTEFFSHAGNKTLIFGDRFPFLYFAKAYGLDYYAAFPGCGGESEPSAATIAFLVNKVKSENISTVFYIEFSNHNVADSIAESTGAKTALFHSCHNVSRDDLESGATFVSLMRQNLETLKEALK